MMIKSKMQPYSRKTDLWFNYPTDKHLNSSKEAQISKLVGPIYLLATRDHKTTNNIEPRSNLLHLRMPKKRGSELSAGHQYAQTANLS